jgi:hypothetical protein
MQPFFAPELIDCIANARIPNSNEIRRVAERIRKDIDGRSSDGRSGEDGVFRMRSLRAAKAALTGTG